MTIRQELLEDAMSSVVYQSGLGMYSLRWNQYCFGHGFLLTFIKAGKNSLYCCKKAVTLGMRYGI